MLAKQK